MNRSQIEQARRKVWMVAVISLMLAQPLAATESAPQPSGQGDSIFQSIIEDIQGWFGEDHRTITEKESQKQTETKPSNPDSMSSKLRQEFKKFKKGMQNMTGKVSDTVERESKTARKNLGSVFDSDKSKKKDSK